MGSAGPDIANIDFDDLTSPQLTDIQRQILEFTEAKRVDFDINEMIAEAVGQAGADDLDDTDGFGDRLRAHVAAIEADDGLRQLSRSTLRQRVVRLLRNRLSLTELVARYPEIESIPIEKPFIVVGMPRSGTTHLVNLIAADPRRRALPYWESQEPIPARGEGPDIFGVDPRYARAKSEHDALMVSAPVVAAMHDRFPEAIEEEVELLDLDLAGYVLEWHARVPAWRDYYLALDQTRHYAYLKKALQALTFLRGPRTWILKSPQHCEQLGPLMATFPDATVAFTHRDPVAVVQSAITMMAYSDRLRRTSLDPGWLLDYWTDRVHRLLRACVRDRELVPAERSIDMTFHELNGNEMPLLEQLYARGGVELTPKARNGFQRYLDGNPRGKHGRIHYDLQRHFGVSADELRGRFDFYLDRFDVRPE
ncbi:sulfotransferase family protein [Mycobacterium montefiorense]|uniref:Sulfotransferase n=1 Tax=Mycobacterium montefiorense TaxID=154654 RepID=A0AA37UUR6_9MYCO|nr:sulfotransferase [Mycobacterium montefiorense]GBG40795.1 putative sulfotransferase [Mycobacterium montefiorense]GKU36327.1 putative sulfotransferase [Mycobacterium montefiorense]GKU38066.1 putative sulfotransferase [Mycobacterium montefiorense]GKU47756.1 putative sulfotransferase [Mycobacterium montefiorense]GKU53093.1 putative sulfotransferase [Mycobacterium montefiorense]